VESKKRIKVKVRATESLGKNLQEYLRKPFICESETSTRFLPAES